MKLKAAFSSHGSQSVRKYTLPKQLQMQNDHKIYSSHSHQCAII